MPPKITIDGVPYGEVETITYASGQWPFQIGTPSIGDAVSMLRMMGYTVVIDSCTGEHKDDDGFENS